VAVLVAEFEAYLDRPGADPVADGVGYRQGVLWLSPAERADLTERLVDVLRSATGNDPAPDRMPYLLSPILFPVSPPP
jgi:hypothetical protein